MKKGKRITISGMLCFASNGNEDDLLGIMPMDGDDALILAEEMEETQYKRTTLRYYISDIPARLEDLDGDLALTLMGSLVSKYGAHYSEYTGYLWTDEEFNVGGHDLISELKQYIGKFLCMEIVYL